MLYVTQRNFASKGVAQLCSRSSVRVAKLIAGEGYGKATKKVADNEFFASLAGIIRHDDLTIHGEFTKLYC